MNIPVIIPVYNAAGSIEQCLDSVLAQTYKVNYQVITVNDGSINDSFFSYSAIKQKSNRGTLRKSFFYNTTPRKPLSSRSNQSLPNVVPMPATGSYSYDFLPTKDLFKKQTVFHDYDFRHHSDVQFGTNH